MVLFVILYKVILAFVRRWNYIVQCVILSLQLSDVYHAVYGIYLLFI